jgi:hypothetical protein
MVTAEDLFFKHVEGVGTKQSILNAMEEHSMLEHEALKTAISQIKYFREQLAQVKGKKAHWKDYYNTSEQMKPIKDLIPFDEL